MRILVGIGTKDRFGFLQQTIEYNKKMSGLSADWVVIDDGSEDTRVWDYLRTLSDIEIIRNEESRGFGGVRNQLFDLAEEYDCFLGLDDDILLGYEWLLKLWRRFIQLEDDFGIIAPLVVNDEVMFDKVRRYVGSGFSFIEVDGMGGACTLMRKEVYWANRYVESTPLYYHPDADFHGKVKKNWKLGICCDVIAVHLQNVVWLDPEREINKIVKLRSRQGREQDEIKAEIRAEYLKRVNSYIKSYKL